MRKKYELLVNQINEGKYTGCKCQYKNAQKVENKNVHFPRAIPRPVIP